MIRELFYYDETSPSGLRWSVNRYSWGGRKLQVTAGDVAGSPSNTGHYSVRVEGKLTKCHRVVFELVYGSIPEGCVIDHIDGNPRNNSVFNLRAVTMKVNSRNRKLSKANTTGMGGVSELRYRCSALKGYVVNWRNPVTGKKSSKQFSFYNYGLFAFEFACRYRKSLLESFNEDGAGYSSRHIGSVKSAEHIPNLFK